MRVTSELRGEHYRDSKWIDRYGVVWTWDQNRSMWRGNSAAGEWFADDDKISDYSLFGGRGTFTAVAE